MFSLNKPGMLESPTGDDEQKKYLDKFIPYEYVIKWLLDHESRAGIKNRLLILKSGIASGKSMTIPAEIFISFIRGRESGGGIICTHPRVLTAIDNAKQMSSTIPKYKPFLKLGETIGWSTQFSKQKPKRIGLLSATIGILMMQLQLFTDAEIRDMYRFIIIDEAHERSLWRRYDYCIAQELFAAKCE